MKRKGRNLFLFLILMLFLCLPFTLFMGGKGQADGTRWASNWTQVPAGQCVTGQHPLGNVPLLGHTMQAYYVIGSRSYVSSSPGNIKATGPEIVLDQITSTQYRVCNNGAANALIQVILE